MELSERKPVDEVAFLEEDARNLITSISEGLADPADVDAALAETMVQVRQFLTAEELSIFLVDEPGGDLVLRYASGEVGNRIIGLRLQSGQGVVGWVVKYSEELIVPYPGMDVRFFDGVDQRTGFTTRSILCSPIRVDGRTIGAIEVLNKKEGTFNDDDLTFLRVVTRLVAEVIPTTGS
jgi:sigma-B regulation protein RsbU (phosphoserine phosphatase)